MKISEKPLNATAYYTIPDLLVSDSTDYIEQHRHSRIREMIQRQIEIRRKLGFASKKPLMTKQQTKRRN